MKTVNINGLSISQMTLGTVQLGLPYGIANKIGKPDQSLGHQILGEAIRGGINCFDTAMVYGDSERILGDYFADKDKPFIISKLMLDIDGNTTLAGIQRQVFSLVEGSLARLNLAKIPLMMLHKPSILHEHGEAVTAAFRAVVRDGLAERMGISFGAEVENEFWEIWKYARDDVYEAVQIPINIFDHRLIRSGALGVIGEAKKMVFARSIFLQGLLHMYKEELPVHLSEAGPYLETLKSLATKEGLSIAQMAVAFVRDLPVIHSLVIGVETEEQVITNIDLMNCPAISEPTRKEILRLFGHIPEFIISPQLWNLDTGK
ncbi:aldo/keto reductase [Paenibacillus agricola]|uniref:Aldo/keto reductase n=1 Tax=Paenibacillus agricola TaxID=2716264 RepID=A0ABX0JC26_9BACL|nr:aldo/keto reductase [Paenibacillus agricola]NHN32779.1 aldo/keto reductase [Paenibacillus agricola]